MRLIDADQFLVFGYNDIPDANLADGVSFVLDKIDNAPTIDAVEVVRCKDCAFCEDGVCTGHFYVDGGHFWTAKDNFCSRGEIKNDTN